MLQPVLQPGHTLRRRLQPPDALLVEEILAAQRPDRAQIDDVARQFVVAGLARKNVDFLVAAAVDHLQFRRSADFAREPYTTRTHDTAVREQHDLVADVMLVLTLLFRFLQPALSPPEAIRVILQEALARLIADRAVQRMVQQQIFQRRLLCGPHFFAVGDDHHPVLDRRLAARQQLALHRHRTVRLAVADFHQAHAATGHHRQRGMPAVVRNLHAGAARAWIAFRRS